MADVLRDRGCDVHLAAIEFTEPRYVGRFSQFPMPHPFLISYLGSGDYRERYLGVKIPPTNIQDYHLEAARKFADGLANRLASTGER